MCFVFSIHVRRFSPMTPYRWRFETSGDSHAPNFRSLRTSAHAGVAIPEIGALQIAPGKSGGFSRQCAHWLRMTALLGLAITHQPKSSQFLLQERYRAVVLRAANLK